MKLNSKSAHPSREGLADRATAEVGVSKHFRLLKWNELVRHGDFTVNLPGEFELWEGPTGFRADAFVKPIYRRDNSGSAVGGKSP